MTADADPGADSPRLYDLSVSGWAYDRLQELVEAAKARGDGEEFLAALGEFHRRLRLYPQFGDPLVDLLHEEGEIRLGVVPPLAMRYGVLEARRLVFVATRPVLMPMATLRRGEADA